CDVTFPDLTVEDAIFSIEVETTTNQNTCRDPNNDFFFKDASDPAVAGTDLTIAGSLALDVSGNTFPYVLSTSAGTAPHREYPLYNLGDVTNVVGGVDTDEMVEASFTLYSRSSALPPNGNSTYNYCFRCVLSHDDGSGRVRLATGPRTRVRVVRQELNIELSATPSLVERGDIVRGCADIRNTAALRSGCMYNVEVTLVLDEFLDLDTGTAELFEFQSMASAAASHSLAEVRSRWPNCTSWPVVAPTLWRS
ncbi:MAG: hypothetical protein KDA71_23205, partial [Planctomycetales bacterium]|nr:hypothetical protein [Planctomycetales bacterium]